MTVRPLFEQKIRKWLDECTRYVDGQPSAGRLRMVCEDWLRLREEIETLRRDLENCDAAYRSLANPGVR